MSLGHKLIVPATAGSRELGRPAATPSCLSAFIRLVSARHQLWLALLSVLVFAAGIIPLELQRRIVNDAFVGGRTESIIALAALYAAVALSVGLLKLAMNIYRSYVSESAVRWLRASILADLCCETAVRPLSETQGVEVSLVLEEAEPIGSFVGVSVSEPLLEGGILLSVFAYLIYLNPLMGLVALAVFSPQLVFVPLMQRVINRRVAARIGILRQISVAILREPNGGASTGSRQEGRIEEIFGLNMGVYKVKFSMNFLMNSMHHLGTAAILGLGGYFVVMGETEVGTVVVFLSGLTQINDPWGGLVNWFRDLKVTQTRYDLIVSAIIDLRAPSV